MLYILTVMTVTQLGAICQDSQDSTQRRINVGQLYFIEQNKGEEKAVANKTCVQRHQWAGFWRRDQVLEKRSGQDRGLTGAWMEPNGREMVETQVMQQDVVGGREGGTEDDWGFCCADKASE